VLRLKTLDQSVIDKRVGPFNCGADEVCTNSKNGCEKKTMVGSNNIESVCAESNGGCQECPAGKIFTCVSRTQASLCFHGKMSPNIIINCEENEICISDAEMYYGNVCVPICAANFVRIRYISFNGKGLIENIFL